MTRPGGWTVSELALPTSRLGLRFTDADVESDYRVWRVAHVRAFAQFALYAAAGAAGCAWIAVLFGALEEFRGLTLVLIPAMVAVLLAGAVAAGREERAGIVAPLSALVSLGGGVLAVAMTYPTQSAELTGACVAITAYFGLALYRLPPLLALGSVTPYVVLAAAAAIRWHAGDDIDDRELAAGLFIPVTALLTGMVLNLAVEWLTRQTYLDHLVIEHQAEQLIDERSAMARFIGPDIAETARLAGAQVHPEIYSLTAVSVDLRGFTTFTQRHGAEFMVQVLQEYYAVVIETATEYGAAVKDFAGDGALILVGAPYPRPDHTRVGLRLARDLIARVREVTQRWSTPETPLGAGIGISSGECAVGAIGTGHQLEYAAIGTTVNLSARLCSIAEDGQILMGPGTARALEESPGWRREVVTLAGIAEPVEVTIEDTLASLD